MHPIEHLRYLVRSDGIEPGLLVEEAAHGLSGLRSNRPEMVAACRRLLAQQSAAGALWDLAARLLTSPEPQAEANRCLDELRVDRTATRLVARLPDDAAVATAAGSSSFVGAFGRRGDLRIGILDVEGRGTFAERQLRRTDSDAVAVDVGQVFGLVEASDVVVVEALAVGPDEALVDPGSGVLAALAAARDRPTWLVIPARSRVRAEYWEALRGRPIAAWEYLSLASVDRIGVAGEVVGLDGMPELEQPMAPELLVGTD